MAVWSSLGNGARMAFVAAGGAVLAAAGWLAQPEAPPEPVAIAALPVATPAPAPVVAEAPVAAPEPPRFDLVRIEPDGAATVAGRAAAGAVVSLRIDGVEVAQATADANGSFAALLTLPASAAPRLMSLAATVEGVQVLGPDTVAIAATALPPEPAPAPEPEPQVAASEPAPALAPVAEPAAPAAILLTENSVKVLQPATELPAELIGNVSIDTISYAPDGAVQLGGRGAGFVRIYLDDAIRATVTVGADGQWATVLADVPPGIYTLRADQIGADGVVISRFETPFKRETLQALAAAAAPVEEPAPVVAEQAPAPEPVAEAAVPAKPAPAEVAPAAEAVAPVAPAVAEPVAVVAVVPPEPVSITVQPGFTLWSIAQERFGEGVMYVQVFEANKDKIRDPDLIYPGQVFKIPEAP